jgi:hypothetical protein
MMIIQNVGNEILLEQLEQTIVGVQNFEPLLQLQPFTKLNPKFYKMDIH